MWTATSCHARRTVPRRSSPEGPRGRRGDWHQRCATEATGATESVQPRVVATPPCPRRAPAGLSAQAPTDATDRTDASPVMCRLWRFPQHTHAPRCERDEGPAAFLLLCSRLRTPLPMDCLGREGSCTDSASAAHAASSVTRVASKLSPASISSPAATSTRARSGDAGTGGVASGGSPSRSAHRPLLE
jgi:hypothetical protein